MPLREANEHDENDRPEPLVDALDHIARLLQLALVVATVGAVLLGVLVVLVAVRVVQG